MITRSRRKAGGNVVGQIPVSRAVQSGSELPNEHQSADAGQAEVSKLVQNHLILEEITGYLSFSELKQFRLVSRQWNQESLPIIRKRVCSINLIPGTTDEFDNDKYFLVTDAVKYGKVLLKLIKRSSAGFPCTEFGLTTELLQVDKWLFYSLLQRVSSFVTKLELYVEHRRVPIDMSTLQFPCLRALKLWQDDVEAVEEMLKCFQHIINNATILDNLTLEINSESEQQAGDFLTAISSSPIRGQLRALDFRTHIMDEHLLALREMGLRLTKFGVEFRGCSEVSSESVISFLESQKKNLKELRIENWEYKLDEEFPLRLPCMQKLSVLNLQVNRADFPELSFFRDLPALKRLECGNDFLATYYFPSLLNDRMEAQSTLETLVIPVGLDDFEVMNQAARIFPKLKKLECHLPEEARRTVGHGLDNLEELSLHVETTSTHKKAMKTYAKFMTGYSANELDKIEESWSVGGELETKGNKRPSEFLQKLKVLRLHGGKLTDLLCLLGPLKLRSLECLDLRESTDSEITQCVLDQMRKKFTVLIEDDCVIRNQQNDK